MRIVVELRCASQSVVEDCALSIGLLMRFGSELMTSNLDQLADRDIG
jgi:hypothetical protein